MPGLYDRLMNQLGDEGDEPAGLTPLDLVDLPDDQRRVMFIFLRDTQAATMGMTLAALQEKLVDMDTLADTLAELTQKHWLVSGGEPVRYKINLARKRGSKSGSSLWTALDDHLAGGGEKAGDASEHDW